MVVRDRSRGRTKDARRVANWHVNSKVCPPREISLRARGGDAQKRNKYYNRRAMEYIIHRYLLLHGCRRRSEFPYRGTNCKGYGLEGNASIIIIMIVRQSEIANKLMNTIIYIYTKNYIIIIAAAVIDITVYLFRRSQNNNNGSKNKQIFDTVGEPRLFLFLRSCKG